VLEDLHIYAAVCDGYIEEDGTNYAPLGHPTPTHQSSLNEEGSSCITLEFTLAQTRKFPVQKFRCNIFIDVRIIQKKMPCFGNQWDTLCKDFTIYWFSPKPIAKACKIEYKLCFC
jgi:hypothetical protein